MNILYVVSGIESYSGATKQAINLAKYMAKENYNISILDISPSGDNSESNIEVNGAFFNLLKLNSELGFIRQIRMLYRYLKSNNIKLVHFHIYWPKLLILCKTLKIKTILKTTLYKSDDYSTLTKNKGIIKKKITKYILKNIDINVVLTQQLYEINKAIVGEESNIKIIPNGVNIKTKNIDKVIKREAVFCCVGVVCERKGTLESILYFNNNYASINGSRLLIAGPYDGEIQEASKEYYTKCLDTIRELKLGKKVEFLGNLSSDKLEQLYVKSIGLLFFSKREGMPNVVLEAMANNIVPIVAPLDGVSSEIIDDTINGFILDDINKAISFEQVKNIEDSNAPYLKVSKVFSFENISKQYKNIYRELEG